MTGPLPTLRQHSASGYHVFQSADLALLETSWRVLQERTLAPVPFHTYDWVRICARYAEQNGSELAIVVIGSIDNPKIIAPLDIGRQFGVIVARWLGKPLVQYGDILVDPSATPEDEAMFLEALRQLPVDALLLQNIREGSAITALLNDRQPVVLKQENAPFLDLAQVKSPDDLFEKKTAKKNTYALRRLSELGDMEFRVITGEEARPFAGAAIDLKRAWLEQRGFSGRVFESDFWRPALIDLAAAKGGMVSVLTIDGKLAAAEIGFRHRGHYVAHVGAFDETLSKYSPGRGQMTQTIRWCHEQGLKQYDLLAPDDGYKHEWTTDRATVIDLGKAFTLRGHAYLAMRRLRPRAKAAYHALPPPLRRFAMRVRQFLVPIALFTAAVDVPALPV